MTAPVHSDSSRRPSEPEDEVDVLLVATPGGHLLELYALRAAWSAFSSAWVTMDSELSRSLLRDERVIFAHKQMPRSARNLLRNTLLAWRLARRLRPSLVITTGAALAVPFAWVARLHGTRVVFVESITRIDGLSLTGRLVAPIADRFYTQWPELADAVRGARFSGNVISLR